MTQAPARARPADPATGRSPPARDSAHRAPPAVGRDAALPTFLIIGATKCGTTSLHDWLSRHEQVFMHPWKEMRFFLDDGRWSKGPAWYARQFAARAGARTWGEASNGYTRGVEHAHVPERVARLLPDARLIYVVREPMARLVSHYRHRLATGREWRRPDAAVRADPAYVATGLYGAELARWHAHVDPARLLVVPVESLAAAPACWLTRIARHLGVDPAPDLPFGDRNAARDRQALPAPLRRLGAVPTLRTPLKRLAPALARHLPGATPLSQIPVDLPREMTEEIGARFADDRRLLERLAGPGITKDWP